MIRGIIHLQNDEGGTRAPSKDIARVEFHEESPLEVIRMLKSSLEVLEQRYERTMDKQNEGKTPDVPRLPVATHNGQECVVDGWLYRYNDGEWRPIRLLNSRQIALRENKAKIRAREAQPEIDEDDEEEDDLEG